jgi:hypothetical protein
MKKCWNVDGRAGPHPETISARLSPQETRAAMVLKQMHSLQIPLGPHDLACLILYTDSESIERVICCFVQKCWKQTGLLHFRKIRKTKPPATTTTARNGP